MAENKVEGQMGTKIPADAKIPSSITGKERFSELYNLFLEYKELKDQPIRFLNKNGQARSIMDYVKDGWDRMNEYQLKPSYKETWQQNIFDPKTRDKVIAILSILAANRMKPEVLTRAASIFATPLLEDKQRIFSDLLEAANRHNRDNEQLVWEMYTCLAQGIVVGYESWKKDTRDVEYIKEFDTATGKYKSEKIKYSAWDDVFGEIVPIDEWYPETWWTNTIESIHRCFWVRELTLNGFKDAYGGFSHASKVQPKSYFNDTEDMEWGISSDIDADNVQVIHYYDEITDTLEIYGNTEEIYSGPLPWNHKKLPFWVSIPEPIHPQLLIGKSLPDKLMSMQDVNNAILNGMLDQLFLAVNSPIFVDGNVDDLDQGYLEPGRIYVGDPGSKMGRVALGANDPASFQLLQLIQRSMEETAISSQNQGVPSGGRKTKFEVQQLQEGALNLAGLFLTMMEQSMVRKYYLRLYNLLQYYAMPSQTKSGKKKFKFFTLEDRKMTNGKMGKKHIQIFGSKEELPTEDKLMSLAEQDTGEMYSPNESLVEPIAITRDFLMSNDLENEIIIVPNSSVKESQAQKDSKQLAFYNATLNNPMVDQERNLKDFAKMMGVNPDIVKKPEPPQQNPNDLMSMLGGGEQPAPEQQPIQTGNVQMQ